MGQTSPIRVVTLPKLPLVNSEVPSRGSTQSAIDEAGTDPKTDMTLIILSNSLCSQAEKLMTRLEQSQDCQVINSSTS